MSFFTTLIAQADPIGKLAPPVTGMVAPVDADGRLTGMLPFLNSILRLLFIIAGIWAFFNLIMAGFGFMNAGGDAEAVSKAWEKIYQSIIGLVIIVSSFIIAAIIGMLLFKDPTALLNPKL